jgi:hypothetical protein
MVLFMVYIDSFTPKVEFMSDKTSNGYSSSRGDFICMVNTQTQKQVGH